MKQFSLFIITCVALLHSTNVDAQTVSVEFIDTVKNINGKIYNVTGPVSNGCKSNENQSNCELVDQYGFESIENGKLSAFWGYEFVGIDLMQKLLKNSKLSKTKIATSEQVNLSELPLRGLSKELKLKLESNYEYSGGSHGTKVNNIILGDYPIGISSNVELTSTEIFKYTDDDFTLTAESFIQKGIKIFQASESVYDDKIDYLKKIIDAGVITIRSAGNNHPESGVAQSSPSLSIIVGQLSPLGVPSIDSSEGESVTILAPGRNYSYGDGKHKVFGGTSGAQPIVAGCLANIVSILPDLNQEEANRLLVKTAIPTLNSKDKIKKNGAGTINCYKLTRVALALKSNWPHSRALIELDKTYDFLNESQNLMNKAEQINTNNNVCSMREKLDLLREAFLLNPHNRKIIIEISKIYQEAGFDLNSHLYKSLLGINLESAIKINKDTINTKYFSGDILRYSIEHLDSSPEILLDALESSNEETVIFASLNSKDKVDTKKIESHMVDLVLNEKIDDYNYSLFEKAYFIDNNLDAKALLDACDEKTSTWETEEYNPALISCFEFLKYDEKEALKFLKKQFKRKSSNFMTYFDIFLQPHRKRDDKEDKILLALIHDETVDAAIKEKLKKVIKK